MDMTTTPNDLMTRAEAATAAEVDVRTIDRWADAGTLTRYRVNPGRRVMFSAGQLNQVLRPVPETALAPCGCPTHVVDYEGHQAGCEFA